MMVNDGTMMLHSGRSGWYGAKNVQWLVMVDLMDDSGSFWIVVVGNGCKSDA